MKKVRNRLLSLLLAACMLIGMLPAAFAADYAFADDDGTGTWSWAGEYIYDCYAEGIISGYADGTFLPDGSLTRAEAATIIARAFGLTSEDSESSFSDVSTDYLWALAYIEACAGAGIISGYSDGTFLPGNNITRAEMAKMIAVACGLLSEASESSFSDVSESHWALAYIEACVETGIISGYSDGTFLPENNITRAEAAAILSRTLDLLDADTDGDEIDTDDAETAEDANSEDADDDDSTDADAEDDDAEDDDDDDDDDSSSGSSGSGKKNSTGSGSSSTDTDDNGDADDGGDSSTDDDEEFVAYYQDIDPDTVAESEDGISYVTSQLLVVAEESASFDEVEELFSAYDGEIVGYISFTDDYQIQLEGDYTYEELKALCADLEEEEILESVTLSYVAELTTDSVDYTLDPWIDANDASDTSGSDWDEDNPEGKNWWAEAISMPSVWNMDLELETVKVGIIDSMFDTTNEDLDDGLFAKLWNNEDDVSDIYESALAGTGTISVKSARHGTHVAGLIAAQAENYFGIAGVSQNAELYGYAQSTSSYDSSVEAYWGDVFTYKYAIALMLNEGVKVINISWGLTDENHVKVDNGDEFLLQYLESFNSSMTDFLLKYIDAGYEFLICKSGGNAKGCDASLDIFNGIDPLGGITEARVAERIIVVGAAKLISGYICEEEDFTTGDRIDVYAPGVDILSDAPTNITITLSGTSMATPIVSGIAALIWGVNPDLSASQVREIIIESQSASRFQDQDLSSLEKFIREVWNLDGDEYNVTAIVDAYYCVTAAQNTNDTVEDTDTSYGTIVGVIYAQDVNGKVDDTAEFSNLEVMLYDEDGNIILSPSTTYSNGIYTFSALLDPGTYTVTVSADEKETQIQMFTIDAYDVLILSFDVEVKETIIASGTCGTNLTWVLTEDGTLTISGTGAMVSWSNRSYVPWYHYRSAITSVVIEEGATSIGSYAFYGYANLTSVEIPDGVTLINSFAFYDCSSLTSVDIPDSVTSIGRYAFCGCSSLTSVTIPDCVTSIGDSAFNDCSSLTSVTIGESVTTIGGAAFYDCSSLTSITIPDSVTSIGEIAFFNCSSLTAINVDSGNTVYASADGVLYNHAMTELIQYPTGKTDTEYEIPSGVTTIGEEAFTGSKNLVTITIGNSVTTIGEDAFWSCSNLTSVTIGDSVTTIGAYAFWACSSLTSVTIGSGVKGIYQGAFWYCTSLTDVFYAGSEDDWDAIIIYSSNDCLTSATITYNYTG